MWYTSGIMRRLTDETVNFTFFLMNRQRKTVRSQSCKEKLTRFRRVQNFHNTKDVSLNSITKVCVACRVGVF